MRKANELLNTSMVLKSSLTPFLVEPVLMLYALILFKNSSRDKSDVFAGGWPIMGISSDVLLFINLPITISASSIITVPENDTNMNSYNTIKLDEDVDSEFLKLVNYV